MQIRSTTLVTLAALTFATTAWAQKAPAKATPKDTPEVASVKKAFGEVMDTVDSAWFGKPYQGVNAMDISGSLSINLSASAVNAKIEQASQGTVKAGLTKSGRANLGLKGMYLANGDCSLEFSGDSGQMRYHRTGNRGFWYIKDINAYTTRIDPPEPDAPLTFMTWFRRSVLDISSVYTDSSVFKASMGTPEGNLQTLVFTSPTGAYDPKKREQSVSDTLDFWKRGRLEITYDRTTKLPQKAFFNNEAQGVKAFMTFSYTKENRLQGVTFDNQSKGMEGPMSLRVSYGSDGLMNSLGGEMKAKVGVIGWDFNITWSKGARVTGAVPPVGADKKGREDLQSLFYVRLAGQVMDLQRMGLNLRSPALGR